MQRRRHPVAVATPPAHHCHARGCAASIPPQMLMCRRHWVMVPREVQRQVWATYRPGQEVDKRPSDAWNEAAAAAIQAVALAERHLDNRGA